MSDGPTFRPDRESGFRAGALGDVPAEHVATELREERLESGARLLVARPADGDVRANVVLAASLRGFTAMYTELCFRLAQRHRWAVAAPEPFAGRDLELDEREAEVDGLEDDAVLADLVAAADRLGGATSLIGFCLGGMYAYKASALDRFDRIVAFYGMVSRHQSWGPGHADPLDCLGGRRADVLAVLGGRDELVPPADVDSLRRSGVATVVYPDAGHAFAHDPSLPGYRLEDAADAWRRTVAFIALPTNQEE